MILVVQKVYKKVKKEKTVSFYDANRFCFIILIFLFPLFYYLQPSDK